MYTIYAVRNGKTGIVFGVTEDCYTCFWGDELELATEYANSIGEEVEEWTVAGRDLHELDFRLQEVE